jgi:hypothetical protein
VQGAALTQHLIDVNQQLSEKEREWHAEQEKVKGNDHFRCGFMFYVRLSVGK